MFTEKRRKTSTNHTGSIDINTNIQANSEQSGKLPLIKYNVMNKDSGKMRKKNTCEEIEVGTYVKVLLKSDKNKKNLLD